MKGFPNELGLSRRAIIKGAGLTAAAAGALALGHRDGTPVQAHDLRPSEPIYRFEEYEAIVSRPVWYRQVYEWPNIANRTLFMNVRNGLNGYQFSYGGDPDLIQVVVQAYGTANAAMYDDYIWAKYQWGAALGVNDPVTGQPAVRNVWYQTNVSPPAVWPTDRSDPFYADTSIEGLQNRGVLFLI